MEEEIKLVWDSSGTGASITPVSEQLVGVDRYARNIPNITNFNKSIIVYVENQPIWQTFLIFYNKQMLDQIIGIKLIKNYQIPKYEHLRITYDQVILSYNENIQLGEPLSFTLTFGD